MQVNINTKTWVPILLISGAIIGAVYFLIGQEEPLPEGLIQANGRIEGDHYTVASKIPGRIESLFVREGDNVEQGEVVVQIEATQILEKVKQAQQATIATEAQLMVAIKKEQQSLIDAKRIRGLVKDGTVTKYSSEQSDLEWNVAQDQVTAARASYNQAVAALAEARCILNDATIHSPASGVVMMRLIDVGEVVGAGAPLLDIVDMDRLYLKVYVPEIAIGKVRLGLPAQVYIDAYSEQYFPATVRYISSRAEFTPKEVQTPDERVKLVYAVKLYLDENPEYRLTPGLPADAIIRWQEDTPWVKPRW